MCIDSGICCEDLHDLMIDLSIDQRLGNARLSTFQMGWAIYCLGQDPQVNHGPACEC